MTATFESLYTEHVIGSFDKQLRLADLHGEHAWGFHMDAGQITFNDSVAYRIEILGTEDHADRTWMWGWANEASQIPPQLLVVDNALRAYGEQHGIDELTTPMLSMDLLEGHAVGLIASGFGNGKAYYRCPYNNGALFVLITDPSLELSVENPLLRATRVIPECLSAMEVRDQRAAIAAYLRQSGFEPAEDDGKLVVTEGGEPVLTFEFDDLSRLTKLDSHLKPH